MLEAIVMEDASKASRRASWEKWTIAAIIPIVAAVFAAAGGLFGPVVETWVRGPEFTAERIARCVETHDMGAATDRVTIDQDRNANEKRMKFRQCAWPPKQGMGKDGYAEIVVKFALGPGAYSNRATSYVHRFEPPCPLVSVRAQFREYTAGPTDVQEPLRARRGDIISLQLRKHVSWPAVVPDHPFAPGGVPSPKAEEIVLLHSDRYDLESLECVDE